MDALNIAGASGGGTIQFDCGPGAAVIALTEAVALIDNVPGRVQAAALVIPNNTTLDGEGRITLDGQFGATLVFVDRDTTATLRGLDITCSSDCRAVFNRGTLSVSNSTFSNQSVSAITSEGTLRVASSTFSDNHYGPCCARGGAIDNQGLAVVANSTFTGNTAGRGGAISNVGTLTLKRTVFAGNKGAPSSPGELNGGGTIWNFGTLTVENCSISGSSPGALYNGLTATIDRSVLSDNHNAYRPGGAIVSTYALTIRNSQISGNSAVGINPASGGGIANSGTLTIDNSEIFGNSAAPLGGGIANSGVLSVTNSRITRNTAEIYGTSAESFGGGIYNAGLLSLANTTVANNTATDGGGLYTCCGGTVELDHANVTGNTPNDTVP